MSRTWIQYNKPEEPNVTHAGLLLALGLHEHLRVLLITDVYKYLAQVCPFTVVCCVDGLYLVSLVESFKIYIWM